MAVLFIVTVVKILLLCHQYLLIFFARFLSRNPEKMNSDIASPTSFINSTVSSSEETEQIVGSGPSVTKQSESDDGAGNDSSLEVNVSLRETEVSVSNSSQNTELSNGDNTLGSVDEDKEKEEEWLDILGSGQLKKKVSTWLNIVTHFCIVESIIYVLSPCRISV